MPELAQPEGIPATFAEHVALMFDPQVLAQSDGPDPRDLHAAARGELGDLHRDRHSRRAPPALPPRVQAGEDRVAALALLFGLTGFAAYALACITAMLDHLAGDDAADPRLYPVTPPPGERRAS